MDRVGSKIFCKIDALTAVFNNCSIVDVLNAFEISHNLTHDYVEIFRSRYLTTYGYSGDFRMNIDYIGLQVHLMDVMQIFKKYDIELIEEIDPIDFFSTPLPYIRIDMMGKALDQIRSMGVDIDTMIWQPLTGLPEEGVYHYTRMDFAFDLIDYKPEFIKLCRAACELHHDESTGRVSLQGVQGGCLFTSKTGSEDTLYLGKGSGDRCLRMYDKKRQFVDAGNYDVDHVPYCKTDMIGEPALPESWIRIELQCRREKTIHGLLFGDNASFMGVFRYIYEHYAIREGQGRYVPVCAFWDDLFDWQLIPTIIQNAKSVSEYVDPVKRAENYIWGSASSSIMSIIAMYGVDAFILQLCRLFEYWQTQRESKSLRLRAEKVVDRCLASNYGLLPKYLRQRSDGKYEFTFQDEIMKQPYLKDMDPGEINYNTI